MKKVSSLTWKYKLPMWNKRIKIENFWYRLGRTIIEAILLGILAFGACMMGLAYLGATRGEAMHECLKENDIVTCQLYVE